MRLMKRTNIKIPDVINKSTSKNFTQVPNDVFRDENLSYKAKGLLGTLLSNKDGWHSYLSVLESISQDGVASIKTGLQELEEHGYLMRIKYRDKKKKRIRGSFWVYTDHPWLFRDLESTEKELNKAGMVVDWPEKLKVENLLEGNQQLENHSLKILINKKINSKNIISSKSDKKVRKSLFGSPIIPTQFEDFWTIYPKKRNKGQALTAWGKICNKNPKNRPTWKEIRKAVQEQAKSKQWQDKQYIPNASTWLNQSRWLNDASQMTGFNTPSKPKNWTGHREKGLKHKEAEETV